MSKPGGNTPLRWLLVLAFSGTSCDTGRVGVTWVLTTSRDSRSRSRAPLSCRRIPDRLSFSPVCTYGGDTDDAGDFSPGRVGVRSFHSATMLRTDASGDRGDVCGRRNPLVGVTDVRVSVSES